VIHSWELIPKKEERNSMRKSGLYLGTLSKYLLCNLINRDKDKTAEGKDIEITFEQYL